MTLELQDDAGDVAKSIGLMTLGALGGSLLIGSLGGAARSQAPALIAAAGGTALAVFTRKPVWRGLGAGLAVAGAQKFIGRQMPALAGTLEGWADAAAERMDTLAARPVEDIGYTIVDDLSGAEYVPLDLSN